MFKTFVDNLNEIEGKIKSAKPEDIPDLFRDIPLEVFAMLTLNVGGVIPDLGSISQMVLNNQETLKYLPKHPWPEIAAFLPTMPDHIEQKKWNGAYGINLMLKSFANFNSFTQNYQRITGKSLYDSKILDFGCGWGRLLRLFYKTTPYTQLYGVDPWQKSLDFCKQYNLKCNFGLSTAVPDSLPFGDTAFDLVYAFSVFTHISFKSADAALKIIRKRIDKNGLLVITIRPVEYWRLHKRSHNHDLDIDSVHKEFEEKGFVFVPHQLKVGKKKNLNYGDACMSLDFIRKTWPEWEIVHTDLNIVDPYQIVVCLKPV